MIRSAIFWPMPGIVASWSAVAVFKFTGVVALAIVFATGALPCAPITAVLSAMAARAAIIMRVMCPPHLRVQIVRWRPGGGHVLLRIGCAMPCPRRDGEDEASAWPI